ncbi:MAG: nucleotidyltransferase [Paludibacteraceae bacterium]|nr:nucleotidyltransferase [Candidatus Physcocola equi]MCQ2233891.1 nucleotidyltransferase [Paludibacteraceae bacterium]
MTKPVLLVLAAGMGSRYGKLKQLDGVGPSGETIMDYSIFDAIRAGFGKVVFVIRHDFENDFREKILSKYQASIPVEVVFQSLDALPEGFTLNPERVKPWGTNHAIMMAAKAIKEPFAVINADDFYGKESFQTLADGLNKMQGKQNAYCMVAYQLGNTLSEHGTVSRGVCSKSAQNHLTSVEEHYEVHRNENGEVIFKNQKTGVFETIDENAPVSMNMWGFTPDYFVHSDKDFRQFLTNNIDNLKAEYGIPTMVNHLIESNTASIEVLTTPCKWFGVTYQEDRPVVVQKIADLVNAGVYPKKLF